ncbi:MAG: hypothetical protein GTN74_14205 [Proteobacteria bacterium]|nr:hypothetical protein [Pseudomonadota bacterium]NIS71683.1 hypothetical protein [Pseudomonadota bacterium]
MKIEAADIFALHLPLLQRYNHHGVTRSYTDNIIVRLRSNGLEGYGEGVPRSYVTGESVRSAFRIIRSALIASLGGRSFRSFGEVKTHLSKLVTTPLCQNNLSAYCAFELALLDLSCKYWDCSLESAFRTEWHQPPPYSGVVPLLPPDRFEVFLNLLKKNDMKKIKLKVGVQIDFGLFERAFAVLGADVDLRVDANGSWTEKEALAHIAQMEKYGIKAVEQPVAKENLEGLKAVSAHSNIPIVADESVCSLNDAERVLAMRACHVFNVRISKCGGFLGSLAIMGLARKGGLRCQIGCQVGETGILSAAGRHLAGWFDDILYLEGSFGTWALREDIVDEDIRFGRGGRAPPMIGNGLGVTVRQERLRKYAKISETVTL